MLRYWVVGSCNPTQSEQAKRVQVGETGMLESDRRDEIEYLQESVARFEMSES